MYNLNLNFDEEKENDPISLNTFQSLCAFDYQPEFDPKNFTNSLSKSIGLGLNEFTNPANHIKVKKQVGRKKKIKSTYGIELPEIVHFLNRKTTSSSDAKFYSCEVPEVKRRSLKLFTQNSLPTSSLLPVRTTHLNLKSFPKMKIFYKASIIRLSVEYSLNSLHRLDQLKIKNFCSFEQNQNLIKFFTKKCKEEQIEKIIFSHLVNSFSIKDLLSPTEEIFNIISNLKVENNFAVLSNKLDERESLILFNTHKFILSQALPDKEFTIFSVSDDLLRKEFYIQKANDIAILNCRRGDELNIPNKEEEEELLNKINHEPNEQPKSIFLDLTFSLEDQCSLLIMQRKEIRKVKTENLKLVNKLEKVTEKKDLAIGLLKIQHEGNKSTLTKNEELEKKVISEVNADLERKLKYLQNKYGCGLDLVEGFIIESRNDSENLSGGSDQEDQISLINSNSNYNSSSEFLKEELHLCLFCKERIRDVVLLNCGHVAYCLECCEKISGNINTIANNVTAAPATSKKNKKKRAQSESQAKIENFNVKCPSCNQTNTTYCKLIYS